MGVGRDALHREGNENRVARAVAKVVMGAWKSGWGGGGWVLLSGWWAVWGGHRPLKHMAWEGLLEPLGQNTKEKTWTAVNKCDSLLAECLVPLPPPI